VRIVLAEKKIDYDFEIDNPWKPDAKAAKLNPLGKVPALLLDDGRTLFDSRVIVGFLDNASPIARLVPAENRERVEVRRWEMLANPAVQGGLAPFIAALVVAALLAPLRLGGLAVVAAFATAVYFIAGFTFEPLTATRKIILLGLAAPLAGIVIDFAFRPTRLE